MCVCVWGFKSEDSTHTEQKKKRGCGGSCYEHTSVQPINSCQSGNRPVNIEGPGRGGGNEGVKGQLRTIFFHVPSPPDTPCITLCLTPLPPEGEERAGSHRCHLHLQTRLWAVKNSATSSADPTLTFGLLTFTWPRGAEGGLFPTIPPSVLLSYTMANVEREIYVLPIRSDF